MATAVPPNAGGDSAPGVKEQVAWQWAVRDGGGDRVTGREACARCVADVLSFAGRYGRKVVDGAYSITVAFKDLNSAPSTRWIIHMMWGHYRRRKSEHFTGGTQNATFGSLLIANPVSSPPPGMSVRATYTVNRCRSHF